MKAKAILCCICFALSFSIKPGHALAWTLFGNAEDKKIDEAFEKGRDYQKEQDKKKMYNPKSWADTDKQKQIRDEKEKLKNKSEKK